MSACELCGDEADDRYLCERDTISLAERLARLPELADELATFLVPTRSGFGEMVTGRTAGPRSPINEDVFDELQDSRAAAVVRSWRIDVQRVRWPQHSPPPPAGLAADCRWLGMELEWIAVEYPAAGDLAREVRELEAGLRSLVGDPVPRRQRLGTCVGANSEGEPCGAVISRLPGETTLRCRWCGRVYEARHFLLVQQGQPQDAA